MTDDTVISLSDRPRRQGAPLKPKAAAPATKPEPNAVRLGFDFGEFCVELLSDGRFKRRIPRLSLAEALAQVERFEQEGLTRLPPTPAALEKGGAR